MRTVLLTTVAGMLIFSFGCDCRKDIAEERVRDAFQDLIQSHKDRDFEDAWGLLSEGARAGLAKSLVWLKRLPKGDPIWAELTQELGLTRPQVMEMEAKQYFIARWKWRAEHWEFWLGSYFRNWTVLRTTVDGDRATVEFRPAVNGVGAYDFVREDKRWRFTTRRGIVRNFYTWSEAEIELPLAQASVENRHDDEELFVNLHANGRVTVEGKDLTEDGLRQRLRELSTETVLLIRCHRRTPWRVPARVLQILTEPEIRHHRVNFATARADPGPASKLPAPTHYAITWTRLERKISAYLPKQPVDHNDVLLVVRLLGTTIPEEDAAALGTYFKVLGSRITQSPVLLDADPEVQWQYLLRAMDAAHLSGFFEILFAYPHEQSARNGRILLNDRPVGEVQGSLVPPRDSSDHGALERVIHLSASVK